jgi:hypothetical protein
VLSITLSWIPQDNENLTSPYRRSVLERSQQEAASILGDNTLLRK